MPRREITETAAAVHMLPVRFGPFRHSTSDFRDFQIFCFDPFIRRGSKVRPVLLPRCFITNLSGGMITERQRKDKRVTRLGRLLPRRRIRAPSYYEKNQGSGALGYSRKRSTIHQSRNADRLSAITISSECTRRADQHVADLLPNNTMQIESQPSKNK